MNGFGYALLSLAPAAGLLGAYPGGLRAAAVAAVLSAVGGAALVARVAPEDRLLALAAAAWSGAACVYGLFVSRRNLAEAQKSSRELDAVKARRALTAKSLVAAKAKGLEAGREHKETQALYGVIKGLAEAVSWEDIRPKIELAVNQYLGVEDFSLFVADARENAKFHPLTVKNLSGSAGGSWATLSRTLQEHGLSTTQPHVLESPERAVGVPIQDNGELLGYFYARVPKAAEGAALLAKSWTFAFEISFALRRVKLFQEVERLSRIDGLTGVHRRGDFESRLQDETIRAKTFKTSYGLMLLDIDHFKELNDRYGHPFGDQVLRRIGEMLNALIYDTDFVARYGGEEFVILLPRAEPGGALRKAELIRQAVEAEPFSIALESVRVTVSIGIAHFPRDAATPQELVAGADWAMYQAKSAGRNRVVDFSSAQRRT